MLIERLSPQRYEELLPGLADVLVDAVDGGASVGFLAGLTVDRAAAWWRTALEGSAAPTWIATDGTVVGVVRLLPAPQENGTHRGEVSKLLVHRRARGRGVARALLETLEREALARGRWLLVLDTETGSPAEGLYRHLGWRPSGVVPHHSLDTAGVPAPTTYFWKDLRSG